MIVSPCISICKTDPVSGLCYGCGRSDEEKKIWKDPETTDDWKNNNLKEIENRLSGWQLESFKRSYKNKIEKGVSLYSEIPFSTLFLYDFLKPSNCHPESLFSNSFKLLFFQSSVVSGSFQIFFSSEDLPHP